jgi:hypothetical protein
MYGDAGKAKRTITLRDVGDLTLAFDGNTLELNAEERRLVEALLTRMEEHEATAK